MATHGRRPKCRTPAILVNAAFVRGTEGVRILDFMRQKDSEGVLSTRKAPLGRAIRTNAGSHGVHLGPVGCNRSLR